jgi:hypothetical protein
VTLDQRKHDMIDDEQIERAECSRATAHLSHAIDDGCAEIARACGNQGVTRSILRGMSTHATLALLTKPRSREATGLRI